MPLAGSPLAEAEIHLWRVDLDAISSARGDVLEILSADEQARARRFRFPEHRNRFITARGLLRLILSHYLGQEPEDIVFAYSPRGKPRLASIDQMDVRFSVSHSEALALYAFALDRDLGIDLERIRPMQEVIQIASHVFSAREQAVLTALPGDQRLVRFFHGWTQKEAIAKATGIGIAEDPQQIEISLGASEPQLLSLFGDQRAARHWSLRTVNAGGGFIAALAWQTELADSH